MRARENPFRTEQIHSLRYRFLQGDWDQLMQRLRTLNYRAALVGPDGSGKSTLMQELSPRLEMEGLRVKSLFLNDSSPKLSRLHLTEFAKELTERDLVLFDGADLIGPLAWRGFKRMTSKAGGLIITAHRSGLLPTLLECETSPELLGELVGQLVGKPAVAGDPVLPSLFRKHRGNLRNVFWELYDRQSDL